MLKEKVEGKGWKYKEGYCIDQVGEEDGLVQGDSSRDSGKWLDFVYILRYRICYRLGMECEKKKGVEYSLRFLF